MRPPASALRAPPSRAPALFALAVLAFAAPARADGPDGPDAPGELSIQGVVAHPRTLSLADLRALPPVTVETDFVTMKGQRHAVFTGAALWPLLTEAGMVDEPGEKTFFRHVLMARGRDGYAVAVSVGELDPNGEGKTAIIAYAEDGKPVKGLRLVVPGDHHGARAVQDLVAIDVR